MVFPDYGAHATFIWPGYLLAMLVWLFLYLQTKIRYRKSLEKLEALVNAKPETGEIKTHNDEQKNEALL